jgi:hypothetical protein
VLTAIVAACAVVASASSAAPPKALFAPGYNLCRAASLSAIRAAGGHRYAAGIFDNRACTWQRRDLQAGITISTHPVSVSTTLMRNFLAQDGEGGLKARKILVPGTSKAVLVTVPPPSPGHVSKNLFANYAQGAIQINMTAPRSLPDRRLIAVVRLIART